jgi:Tol biopolymer transport system component
MNRFRILSAAVMMAAAMLACESPLATQQPVEYQAATGVAQTLAALAAATPLASPLPSQVPTATAIPRLLPHTVYFLNKDSGGLRQIFRVAVDGKTVQQITFEPAPVDTYDVSPVDGSVAYGTNNQLLLVDANGAGRKVLVDGGPIDDNNRFTNSIGTPVWAPDGKTIAISHGGLEFYSLTTGATSKVLENQIDTSPGFALVRELYAPVKYSPDGTQLLISIGFYEGGTYGIYHPADNSVIRFNRPDGGMVCCDIRWVPDGTGLYVASPTLGMIESGLYYVEASSGLVHVLLPGSAPDNTYNFASGPQVGPDGKLYFFFNNLPQIPTDAYTPLYLVRSDTDGVTGREQLQANVFQNVNEVLWAPDASLALLAFVVPSAGTPGAVQGGQVQIVYPDARPSVTVIQVGEGIKWGP